ncbi:MAG: glycoside hydrolase [Ignavibacteria bacterium]|nr:glycoside hydrolase [Ignavibacteria bacterium]
MRIALSFLLLLILSTAIRAQSTSQSPVLSGYARSLGGEVIDYAGRFPGATDALLVRSIDAAKSIAWETAPVPAGITDDTVRFVWLAGIDVKKESREFALSVNGSELFRFRNPPDSTWKGFEMKAANGALLSFRKALIDVHGDVFGFMTLSLPRALLRPGAQRIEVKGESAGERKWFMVYTMRLEERMDVATDECIVNDNGREMQRLRIGLWRLGEAVDADISIDRKGADGGTARLARSSLPLATGHSEIALLVPPVTADEDVTVTVRGSGAVLFTRTHRLQPVRRFTVYLLPHSHVDIGYTDLQWKVEQIHMNNIDAAIALAEKTQDYPEGSRFVWNVETLWAVDSYLHPRQRLKQQQRDADTNAFAKLERAVKKGWIHLDATYANVNTSACNSEELLQLFAFAGELSQQMKTPINSMMQVDIPGTAWGTVTAAAKAGVRYYVNAPNNSDRIGLIREAWEDKPFYWISPSGLDTLLHWQVYPYSLAYAVKGQRIRNRLWGSGVRPIATDDPTANFLDPFIFDHLAGLKAKNYPYDMLLLSWALSDNAAIDPDLPDAVRAWNERYVSPRVIITSTSRACADLEQRYGAQLPRVRGDYTEYWTDGIGSGARETAMKRNAVESLLQSEALSVIHTTSVQTRHAWRSTLLFAEHTWGAWNSTSDPDSAAVKEQWRVKQSFAVDAVSFGREIRQYVNAASTFPGWRTRDGKGHEIPSPRIMFVSHPGSIDVYNTLSWTRTGMASVPKEQTRDGDRIIDDERVPVPSWRAADNTLYFIASDVPGLAARRYTMERGAAESQKPVSASTQRIENGILEVVIDTISGGIVQLIDTRTGIDYVDRSSAAGMNSYFYLPGDSLKNLKGNGPVTITVGQSGPLLASITVRSSAPGCHSLEREYRLWAGADYLEIENRIDKIAIREKEGVHFGFGFNVPNGTMRIDVPFGTVRPELEQIPGSNKNWFTVQRHVDISNDTCGVTWSTLDAPLIEVGNITARLIGGLYQSPEWIRTLQPSQTLYSWALNNHWHTNFRADQEGPLTFRYAIRPHGPYDAVAAQRFGIERAQPLIAMAAYGNTPKDSWITIDNPAVLVERLCWQKSWTSYAVLMRLSNPTDNPQMVSIAGGPELRYFDVRISKFGARDLVAAEESNPISGPIIIAPHDVVTYKVVVL